MSALFSRSSSTAAAWAEGLAWLWRLGDVAAAPAPALIGVGGGEDAEALSGQVAAGELAGAIVAVAPDSPRGRAIPPRRQVRGVARFDRGTRVEGGFTVFDGGSEVVRSSLGAHAVTAGGVLYLGHDPEQDWGRLDAFWAYEAARSLLEQHVPRQLARLESIGVLRLDDAPGTALHQLEGRAKGDLRQALRIRRTSRRLRSADAVLNIAVTAEALKRGRRVPLDQVWPRSIRAMRAGIQAGAFETVCHGLLHLDTAALERGEIEFREFANLDAAEAADRLDRSLAWQQRHLSRPTTFVAPAWRYGEAADEEAAKRGLIRWYRARPGPILLDGRIFETLTGELPGLHGLDYSPLERLAAIGIPPMIAMHGALLDGRGVILRPPRDPVLLARLLVMRDVTRIIRLSGIRWVGIEEFVAALDRHASAPGVTLT